MFSPRGGLENTVFAIMDSGRSKYYVQPNRMPYFAFAGCDSDPSIMAKGMDKIALEFSKDPAPSQLPLVTGLRYALNVAACDRRPVVIIKGNEEERKQAKTLLAPISWAESYVGQFVFTEEAGPASITIVQPDPYGVKTTILSTVEGNEVERALTEALAKFKTWTNDHRTHLSQGVAQGIRWRPAVPVEDQQADFATKRLWGG